MNKRLFITLGFISAFGGVASAAPAVSGSPFSNWLFWVLLIVIILLFLVVLGLAATAKNLAQAARQKLKSERSGTASPMLMLGLIFLSGSLLAQDSTAVEGAAGSVQAFSSGYAGLDPWIFFAMVFTIIVQIAMVGGLLRIIKQLLQSLSNEEITFNKIWAVNWNVMGRKFNDSIPVENEAQVMTDHEYDGIRELDNNLPPWWKYGFYLTIVFSVVYLFSYHVTKTSPLQLQEYETELAEAELAKGKQLKTAAASVDENTVTAMTDAAMIASGMEIFKGNCASCHGQSGEGGVGPNLTDDFWINGGGLKNIFKVIKYGVPAKGMIAWQQALKPEAIQKVASYILTLHGTKPANGKEPQGELWKESTDSSAAAPSTAAITETK